VIRTWTCTLTLCALPALAGCGTTSSAAYDPDEELLTTTMRRSRADGARGDGGESAEGPASRTWTLIAVYRCPKPEHEQKPDFERRATAEAACEHCRDNRCMPKLIGMRRREHEATETPPAGAAPLPTAAAGR
jgi:hypothetical protein